MEIYGVILKRNKVRHNYFKLQKCHDKYVWKVTYDNHKNKINAYLIKRKHLRGYKNGNLDFEESDLDNFWFHGYLYDIRRKTTGNINLGIWR